MNILGIHDGKDAGVALVVDGRVVFAANEERYSRQKMHFGFPFLALQKLFRFTGSSPRRSTTSRWASRRWSENRARGTTTKPSRSCTEGPTPALTRTLGGVMDSRPATYGALQVLKLLSQNKAELKQNLSTPASRRRCISSTIT